MIKHYREYVTVFFQERCLPISQKDIKLKRTKSQKKNKQKFQEPSCLKRLSSGWITQTDKRGQEKLKHCKSSTVYSCQKDISTAL